MKYTVNGPDGDFSEGEVINLRQDTFYFSDYLPNNRGKYYYEATHISGTNYHLFGFQSDIGDVNFYLYGNLKTPRFYGSVLLESVDYTEKISFSVNDSLHTIGLGLDIVNNEFLIFYDKIIARTKVKSGMKNIRFRIWGANWEGADDNVTFNAGYQPFLYSFPKFFSCLTQRSKYSSFLIRKCMTFILLVI